MASYDTNLAKPSFCSTLVMAAEAENINLIRLSTMNIVHFKYITFKH